MSDQKLDKIVEKIGAEGFEYLKNSLMQSLQKECENFGNQKFNEQNFQNNRNFNQNCQNSQMQNQGLLNSILGGNFSSNMSRNELIKGILIGAGVTYVLTNENAQKALFNSFAKLQNMLNMGLEELKERFEDAKAELEENA